MYVFYPIWYCDLFYDTYYNEFNVCRVLCFCEWVQGGEIVVALWSGCSFGLDCEFDGQNWSHLTFLWLSWLWTSHFIWIALRQFPTCKIYTRLVPRLLPAFQHWIEKNERDCKLTSHTECHKCVINNERWPWNIGGNDCYIPTSWTRWIQASEG